VKETAVEKRLVQRANKAGGMCWKIMPVVAGYPDRLVLLPGGRLFLVETKAPDGALRAKQKYFIARCAAIGIEVAVLYTTRQVDDWIDGKMGPGEPPC
jgi:hypothetical protein